VREGQEVISSLVAEHLVAHNSTYVSITVQISIAIPHRAAYNILDNNINPIKGEFSLTIEVQGSKGELTSIN
jgi:hypothetical protein